MSEPTKPKEIVKYEVSRFTDEIRGRDNKKLREIARLVANWNWTEPILFSTEAAAREFVIDRAGKDVKRAEKELQKTKKRYAKCLVKYAPATLGRGAHG